MQKKINKIRKAHSKLQEREGDQALIRYFFSKEAEVVNKGVSERMQEFIEKEFKRVPLGENVNIELKGSSQNLKETLQKMIIHKVDVQNLLSDSSLVGTTFLDELFESKMGYSSLQLSKIGDVFRQGHSPELMENSRISRILPVHEQSNDLEESSGLLKQLDLKEFQPISKKLSDIEWELKDFFNQDSKFQLLHFFEPKSCNFYYIDLTSLEEFKQEILSQNYQNLKEEPLEIFKKQKIPNMREIPRHHKSLCIPEDCIIITGGLQKTKQGKNLTKRCPGLR